MFCSPWITRAVPRPKGGNEIRSILVFSVVLAVLATTGLLACSGPSDGDPGKNPRDRLGPARTVYPADWVDVDTWQGDGNGEGPRFRISSDVWRVMWKANTDSIGRGDFTVHIYNDDGTFFKSLFDSSKYDDKTLEGPLRGTLGTSGRGDFFLRVTTTRSYDITVQELR